MARDQLSRDDIIAWSREAAAGGPEIAVFTMPELERFANFVAAAEREACAQAVKSKADLMDDQPDAQLLTWRQACDYCFAAIRERNNT